MVVMMVTVMMMMMVMMTMMMVTMMMTMTRMMIMMMGHPRYELVHTSCLAIHKLSQLTNYLHIHPTKLQNMNQAWIFLVPLIFVSQ